MNKQSAGYLKGKIQGIVSPLIEEAAKKLQNVVPGAIRKGVEGALPAADERLRNIVGEEGGKIVDRIAAQKSDALGRLAAQKADMLSQLKSMGVYAGLGGYGLLHAGLQFPGYMMGRNVDVSDSQAALDEESKASILKSLLIPGYYGYKLGVGQRGRDLLNKQEKAASTKSSLFSVVSALYRGE